MTCKELAKQAWKEMWSKVTGPADYIEGGCSFCKVAQERCYKCLLPKYFCEKEYGKLKEKTLISKIRYARDILLERPTSVLDVLIRKPIQIQFNRCLEFIKQGIKDMSKYGKVKKKTEKRILQFLK